MTLYARMHVEGEIRLGIAPQDTFPGTSLAPHVPRIKRLIEATGARTLLDYGSGKGQQYRPQKILRSGRTTPSRSSSGRAASTFCPTASCSSRRASAAICNVRRSSA